MAFTGQNDLRFNDLEKRVKSYGADQAGGDNARINLAKDLAASAQADIIDLDRNKHGSGVDDTAYLYGKYVEVWSKKDAHDHTGKPQKASEFRNFTKMGKLTWCDATAELERFGAIREELAKVKGAKLRAVFQSYLAFAREMNKEDRTTLLDDDEIKSLNQPTEAADKTVRKEVERLAKATDKLISGALGEQVKCQDQEVLDAAAAFIAWLDRDNAARKEQEEADKVAELAAYAASRGLTLVAA